MSKHGAMDHRKTVRFLAAALFLAATQLGGAGAYAVCAEPDPDCDGFTTAEENAGIPIDPAVFTFVSSTGSPLDRIPPCAPNTAYPGRADCMDPQTPDLFVVLVRMAPTSKIPANPWKFVNLPVANGGLGIAVHELRSVNPVDRLTNVTATQRAAWISETFLAASGTDLKLGFAEHTTPNAGNAYGTIYTQRIETEVNNKCSAVTDANCKDSGGTWGKAAVTGLYIQHTLAHELAHMLYLTTVSNSRYDGWHYKSGSGYVLDQSVASSSSGGKVTFNITKIYTPADQAAAKFK